MVDGTLLGFAANATIAVAYLAVAVMLAVNISRTRQWRLNPLAAATFFLYVTCGGGHAVYAIQLGEAVLGVQTAAALGARDVYQEVHMWAWDGLTAAVGVWYWTMRKRFPDLVSGTAVFEDLRERHKRALAIHDNVVQGLVRAKLSLDLRQDDEVKRALVETLDASDRIVGSLTTPAADPAPKGAP